MDAVESFEMQVVEVSGQRADTDVISVGCQTDTEVQSTTSVECQTDPFDIESLSAQYAENCKKVFNIEVPKDYLQLSAMAMSNLKRNNRLNVVYHLVKVWEQ